MTVCDVSSSSSRSISAVQWSVWEGKGGGRAHIWSPADKGLTAQGWLGSVHHHKDDVLQLKQLLYSVSNVCYWRPVGQLMTIIKRLPFTSDLNYHQEKCILLYIFHLTLKHLVFSTVLTWKIIKKSIDGILNYNCFHFWTFDKILE